MNKIKWYIILLFVMLCFPSCSEDDYVYPSVLTHFIGAQTNSKGFLDNILLDNGDVYSVKNGKAVSGLTPDSLYRWVAIYALEKEMSPSVTLYGLKSTVSSFPIEESKVEGVKKMDPITVQSIRLSGEYIDIVATFLIKERQHIVSFLYKKGVPGEVELSLYHDKRGDKEAYPKTVYLSIPLSRLQLKKGDKVSFTLKTYKESVKTYQFFY